MENEIHGTCFLEFGENMDEHVEAAYRIVMDLQERGYLKAKIDRNGKEPLVIWKLSLNESNYRQQ